MDEKETEVLRKGGIKIGKNESVLEAIRNGLPHWIHETVDDDTYVIGKR